MAKIESFLHLANLATYQLILLIDAWAQSSYNFTDSSILDSKITDFELKSSCQPFQMLGSQHRKKSILSYLLMKYHALDSKRNEHITHIDTVGRKLKQNITHVTCMSWAAWKHWSIRMFIRLSSPLQPKAQNWHWQLRREFVASEERRWLCSSQVLAKGTTRKQRRNTRCKVLKLATVLPGMCYQDQRPCNLCFDWTNSFLPLLEYKKL